MSELFADMGVLQTRRPIEPFQEMLAYEALWQDEKASFKRLSELFAKNPGMLPSDLVGKKEIATVEEDLRNAVLRKDLDYKYYILINGTFDYPAELKDAKEPLEVLYYSGNLDLLGTKRISIVGTRKPSPKGVETAQELAISAVKADYTIISGLALGIDTIAHKTAIENKGRTIAVIGTPLDTYYPKENVDLQKYIAKEHLLISQVPFVRYKYQSINGNRLFFPERNKTMSALSLATVIVEAGDTSGTLIQARAAIQQGRKLFILETCFQNPSISWPKKYVEQGALRVKNFEEILQHLNP